MSGETEIRGWRHSPLLSGLGNPWSVAVGRLCQHLSACEVLKWSGVGDQLGVSATLDDHSAVQDVDAIGVDHRAEPVGDRHPGGPAELGVDALADVRLGAVVQSARGLVKQKD